MIYENRIVWRIYADGVRIIFSDKYNRWQWHASEWIKYSKIGIQLIEKTSNVIGQTRAVASGLKTAATT